MKEVKIVVGANYGDEGKGLLSRYFSTEANSFNADSITILHNGTAQRGHTVDYSSSFRHVYHHFGSGTGDGTPTFFANTFLVHPMEFVREYCELAQSKIYPICFCDPDAKVITPFDMLVDHMTEAYLEKIYKEREYGSCGYGSWCATDRFNRISYTVKDFSNSKIVPILLNNIWKECQAQLVIRGVDIELIPEYKKYFVTNSIERNNLIKHFENDLLFFFSRVKIIPFNDIYKEKDYIIFENGQGLGLDKNISNDWHTTSNTGITNPIEMLKDKNDFSAEVCYVTRSYLTRHGKGPLEQATDKNEINSMMLDRTNLFNDFQGPLRYGFLEDDDQADRIIKDYSLVMGDHRFKYNMAVTHCNELESGYYAAKYRSYSPFSVDKY